MATKNNPQESKSAFDAVEDASQALWQAKSIAVLISLAEGGNVDSIQGAAFAVVELIARAESELSKINAKPTPIRREQEQGAAA